MNFALQGMHAGFVPLFQQGLTQLAQKYPQAKLGTIRVVPPGSESDFSMGCYDQGSGDISLNGYWFGEPPEFLQTAAKAEPAFHGRMVEEPRHLITHEFAHALEYGLGFDLVNPRVRAVWASATQDPGRAPADYALANPTEYFAELFACVEMGLASPDHLAQLRYCMGD